MDGETLERLVMDRCLDELGDDATALLNAYLADHPESAELARRFEATLTAVQQASSAPGASIEPPPAVSVMMNRMNRTLRMPVKWHWPRRLAMAASIGLAFWIGAHLPTAPTPDTRPAPEPVARAQTPQPDGFWSRTRLQHVIRDRKVQDGRRIQWSGPLRWPQMGGAL